MQISTAAPVTFPPSRFQNTNNLRPDGNDFRRAPAGSVDSFGGDAARRFSATASLPNGITVDADFVALEKVAREVFGRPLSGAEYAELVGAPAGAKVLVRDRSSNEAGRNAWLHAFGNLDGWKDAGSSDRV